MKMQNQTLWNSGWKFMQNWSDEMILPDYDDSNWRILDLPHDWSIEGKFSPDAVSCARGSYLPTGTGCYRKTFLLPENAKSKICKLFFEGVFKKSSVYLNGNHIGGREFGYLPFESDLTPYLKKNTENVVVVKVDNSAPGSARWYAGSGIYRNVYFETYETMWFVRDSIQILTDLRNPAQAVVSVNYKIRNLRSRRTECQIIHAVYDKESGEVVAESSNPHWISPSLEVQISEKITVADPELWGIENPHLYTLKSQIVLNGETLHSAENVFGFRKFEYSADTGLYLNGNAVKVKGCCLHNDGGSLGAAVTKETFIRQIRILKTMACNAVRTAHHPFSPEFLDACDELGMLVLNECFDSWEEPQRAGIVSNGEYHFTETTYYPQFERDSKRDLMVFVMRDRNHPSVFMWSVGNEVPQMYKYSGERIAGELTEVVHNFDETRPVTCAVVLNKLRHENIARLDVGGYNYIRINQIDEVHRLHPEQPMLGTECYSVQTRHPLGKYYADGKMKEALDDYYPIKYIIIEWLDHTLIGQENWDMAENCPYMMGQFIWTGWDYLGEPTPYDYPAHTSFFGVIDTCGFPKDGYYYYRSAWTDTPTVHISSHWDYEPGDMVTLLVYSNCFSVELFINGKSHGRKYSGAEFRSTPAKNRTSDEFSGDTTKRMFMWTVPYEPGCVEAIGIPSSGEDKTLASDKVWTSGKPVCLKLSRCPFNEDSEKIIYMTCEVLDEDQRRCRNAELDILWSYDETKVKLKALDSGYQLTEEPFQGVNHRKTCAGRSIAIFERIADGDCEIKISTPGLKNGICTVEKYVARKPRNVKNSAPVQIARPKEERDSTILALP